MCCSVGVCSVVCCSVGMECVVLVCCSVVCWYVVVLCCVGVLECWCVVGVGVLSW